MPDYRTQFADFGGTIYLNCAYQGVFPLTAAARAHEAIELKCHPERMDPAEYFDLPKRVSNHLARMIGGDESGIALTSGATQGIGVGEPCRAWDLNGARQRAQILRLPDVLHDSAATLCQRVIRRQSFKL